MHPTPRSPESWGHTRLSTAEATLPAWWCPRLPQPPTGRPATPYSSRSCWAPGRGDCRPPRCPQPKGRGRGRGRQRRFKRLCPGRPAPSDPSDGYGPGLRRSPPQASAPRACDPAALGPLASPPPLGPLRPRRPLPPRAPHPPAPFVPLRPGPPAPPAPLTAAPLVLVRPALPALPHPRGPCAQAPSRSPRAIPSPPPAGRQLQVWLPRCAGVRGTGDRGECGAAAFVAATAAGADGARPWRPGRARSQASWGPGPRCELGRDEGRWWGRWAASRRPADPQGRAGSGSERGGLTGARPGLDAP